MTLADIDADLIEPQRLAGSTIDQIKIERRRPNHQGRSITPLESLRALSFEVQLVAVVAQNLAHGMTLAPDDLQRLMLAWARITFIAQEAGA